MGAREGSRDGGPPGPELPTPTRAPRSPNEDQPRQAAGGLGPPCSYRRLTEAELERLWTDDIGIEPVRVRCWTCRRGCISVFEPGASSPRARRGHRGRCPACGGLGYVMV